VILPRGVLRRIKQSSIGKAYRYLGHLAFALRFGTAEPVTYRLPRGIEIRLYPRGEVAEFLFYHPWFERTELNLLAGFLTEGMRLVDVGANIGLYSILADKLVGAHGQVWAFEPSNETYQWLLDNLRCNQCTSVVPIRVALSDRDGDDLILRSDPGFGDAYRYLQRRDRIGSALSEERRDTSRSEVVTTATLDAYAESHDIHKVDFIKVDIEGGEYPFFVGARRILTENQDVVVMFENSPDWCTRAGHRQEDIFALLRGLGFGLYSWSRGSQQWEDSDSRVMGAEIVWATRNYRRLPTTRPSIPAGATRAYRSERPSR